MEIKRYYIPKLPRNKYKYSGSSSVYTGGSGDSVSYVYNNTNTVDVYDGLDSFSVKKALSANQGMVLKGLIDEHITVTDNLQEQITTNLQYTNDNFLNKKNEDTAEKLIHFLEGIDAQGISTLEDITLLGDLISSNFVKDSNGFGIYQDDEGKYHFDIDFVNVRGKFTTESLEVKESTHIGGKIYSTKAGMICSKVEEYDTYYRCYFNTTDADGRIISNQFAVNDQAFMQTFNLSQQANGKIGNRRFWRLVEAIGENYIDLSKTDYESGSDAPLAGDSIVQLGNRNDSTRQGALILEPLSMKVYKGIKSYVLPTPFIDLNPEKSVIEAQLINVATGEDINDTINSINNRIAQVKEQSDKCFTIWMDAYTPTLENLPASAWTTDSMKNEHLQDIFYDTSKEAGSGGRAYRFELNNGVYSWVEITDKDTIAALEQAKAAEDLADSKRRVFVEQPTIDSVYDVGDIWVNANYNDGTTIYKNDELVCITAKTAGMAFSISHWQPTSTATTAYIENLGNQITQAVTDSKDGIDAAKELAQQGIDRAEQAIVSATEAIDSALYANELANDACYRAEQAEIASSENTTVIQQTQDSIVALANKISFDADGNIVNTDKSGLVTTADFNTLLSEKVSFDDDGNVTNVSTAGLVTTANFADMFAEQTTEDGLVKRADISTFITADEAGELVSNATIQADKINFIGKTMINGNFVVDTSGNVTMKNADVTGKITATEGEFNGVLKASLMYSNTIAVTGKEYTINPEESPACCFVFDNPKILGQYIWLPNATQYDGLEVQLFLKWSDSSYNFMDYYTGFGSKASSIFWARNVYSIGELENSVTVQKYCLALSESAAGENNVFRVLPNCMYRLKAMLGAWYVVEGLLNGE